MKISHQNLRCAPAYSSVEQTPWTKTRSGPLLDLNASAQIEGFLFIDNQLVATTVRNRQLRFSSDSL